MITQQLARYYKRFRRESMFFKCCVVALGRISVFQFDLQLIQDIPPAKKRNIRLKIELSLSLSFFSLLKPKIVLLLRNFCHHSFTRKAGHGDRNYSIPVAMYGTD